MPHKSQAALMRLASVALLGLLAACRGQEPPQPDSQNQPADKSGPERLPIVEPPFDRSRLLLTVARAASAHSAGLADQGIQRTLDGKQFEVRLRFGCDGPGPGNGGYGWSLDPDGRTLRLRAVPTLSLGDEVVRSVAGDGVEAVEGFWLPRPWLLQAACPGGRPASQLPSDAQVSEGDPAATTAPAPSIAPRIGIARFFTAEDARTGRRINRPFEAVKQLAEGERAGQDGFDLVLSGRLRARGDGRVIVCAGSGVDRPPDCIVSAAVDRARIERPEDQEIMAEWSL
jgi:hypothetical protein